MGRQCVNEDLWFRNMRAIDVSAPPLPKQKTRFEFMKCYAEDSGKRLALQEEHAAWWEEDVKFLDVRRSRSWGGTRCISHTSHDRGQLMAMLRMLGRDVHSNRADCGYGWADAESCAYDVCISEFGGAVCWRGDGRGEGEVAGWRRESGSGKAQLGVSVDARVSKRRRS
jgi:hypothetical protein